MINVGEPFKMEPLTRKARNSLSRAIMFIDLEPEEISWQRISSSANRPGLILVKAVGDECYETIRWVQTQNDPDWKIV